MSRNPNVLFLSHGGGPMPLLGDEGHNEMVQCLKNIATQIKKPSAILVVSAHWEESIPTITLGGSPSLIYDYYGFPEEAYAVQYPCLGEPELAGQVYKALEHAGIKANLDASRGYDHGVFVPLKIMYPDGDIPCVQLSLVNSLDPRLHIDIGQTLQQVDYENLLIIGSGFSFHNMRAFFAPETDESKTMNESFDDWLLSTCSDMDISEKERAAKLIDWEQAPGSRYCHPREEHLLPLHVCYGASSSHCSIKFSLKILNKKSSMFLWE